MISVLTACLGRTKQAGEIWPQVRGRAGTAIDWTIAIDGDAACDWHEVAAATALAQQYADRVVVLGSWQGCGAGAQAARAAGQVHGAHIRLDADLLPSPGFARGFLDTADAWDDHSLGLLVALHWPHSPRDDVGPRRMPPRQRLMTGLAYLTARGARAIPDYTTTAKINALDLHICYSMAEAGLWSAYSHRVWWDLHDDHVRDDYAAYGRFKAQSLRRGVHPSQVARLNPAAGI